MAETIREFLVSLGYTVDGNSERKFKESMRGAVVQANLIADAIEGMARTVVEGVEKVARSFDSLYWSSQRTGASVQNIRSLSYAVSQLGGTYEGTRAAIETFGQHLRSNPGYASMLHALGISTEENGKMRDQVAVLEDLGKALSKKSYPVALQYAGALGIDEDTLRALMSGDLQRKMEEYTKIQQAAGLDSEEAAKRSKDFMQALRDLQATIEAVVTKVLTDLEPSLTEKLKQVSQWFIDHKEDIKAFIAAVGTAVEGLVKDLGKLVEAFKPVFTSFDELATSLTGKDGLQAAFEAFAVFLATSWLIRVLGVFSSVKVGWLALAALVAVAPTSMDQAKANGNSINDWLGSTSIGRAFTGARNTVRGLFGMAPVDARGNTPPTGVNEAEAGKPLTKSERDQNASETYRMMRDAGLSREAALGVVANEDAESGFNPASVGDSGQAKGSFQWWPGRRDAIKNGTGIDVGDPNTSHADQIKAAIWEMQHGDDPQARKAWELLQDAKSPAEAAQVFTQNFERPKDGPGQSYARGIKANTWATRIPDGDNKPTPAPALDAADKPKYVDPRVVNAGPKSEEKPQTWDGSVPDNLINPSQGRRQKDDDVSALFKNINDNLGAMNATQPLGTGGNVSNDRNVTLNQTTNVSVVGATDPAGTASAIEGRQKSVNSMMLRNTQGAVR